MLISDTIRYVGVLDKDIDLFEGQYKVPAGVSYNSYVILDDKIAIMDTVDATKEQEWLENLSNTLSGRTPDYLVIAHLEPDHSGSIQAIAALYPDMKLVMSTKALAMLPQFVDASLSARTLAMKEGDILDLGRHHLHFVMAPMVHWPEVMVAYEDAEKVLFSADAFGTFGLEKEPQAWLPEARRYFLNIVGKYGGPVQTLLKKAAGLDIAKICPLHGPVLDENLGFYLEKYQTWSTYAPEEKGVLVVYGSLHGNTAFAAQKLANMLKEAGENVVVADVARDDMAGILANAFRFDRMVLASSTYDGSFFPKMEDFLLHLKAKSYQKRTVSLIENGSWAPQAIKRMSAYLEGMADIKILPTTLSIKTKLKPEQESILSAMAEELKNA
ncbi:MAG: FprA family A-type flavoprotein [Clostridiales bacterium]|nr:FprA family A-type flavoprotein [Clostridiales bacterium]